MGGPMNFLLECRFLLFRQFGNFHNFATLGGCMDRLNDAHIGESFQSRGFRIFILKNAVGKIDKLGGELIALGKFFCFYFAVYRELMFDAFRIFIGRIDDQHSLRAHESVAAYIGRSEAAGKGRHALFRKTEQLKSA